MFICLEIQERMEILQYVSIHFISKKKMTKMVQNLYQVKEQDKNYDDNFQSQYGECSRRGFLYHTLGYLQYMKKKVKRLQPSTGLTTNDLKGIRAEDTSAYLGKLIGQHFETILTSKDNGQNITEGDIFKLVYSAYKPQIWKITGLFLADAFFRLAFSLLLYNLFTSVMIFQVKMAYLFASILTVFWYLSRLFRQAGFTETCILSAQIKTGLLMLLYNKISQLTSYSLKTAQVGKITNLLATDLGAIEQRFMNVSIAVSFPLMMAGVAAVMYIRIGWIGIAAIVSVIVMVLLSSQVSRFSTGIVNEINKFKDKRIKTTAQTIEGIKYIKLYGWQLPFKKYITDIRDDQISNFRKLALVRSFQRAVGDSIAYVGALVVIMLALYFKSGLTFAKIFSSLQIMTSLKYYILSLVIGIGLIYQIKAVFGRFANILNMENFLMIKIDPESRQILSSKEAKIQKTKEGEQSSQTVGKKSASKLNIGDLVFESFNGFWTKELETPSLKNINFKFHSRCLYGITGKIGSGKSGFLGAIVKQIPYFSGGLVVKGSIALLEQEPTMFSDTVKNNILFGKKFKRRLYEETVKMSNLISDFKQLQNGDQTIVGDKGLTLSGGQKARIALARCIYAQTDILLLDDPLSAVDSKVAKNMFEKCLKVLSRTKTVILVTHQINFLYGCDEVIVFDDGAIIDKGTPLHLKKRLQELSQTLKKSESQQQKSQSQSQSQIKNMVSNQNSQLSKKSSGEFKHNKTTNNSKLLVRFLQKEVKVTRSTYYRYFFASKKNYLILTLVVILFITFEAVKAIFYRVLAMYDDVQAGTSVYFGGNSRQYEYVLGLLVVFMFVNIIIKYFLLNLSIFYAGLSVHQKMVEAILHSPASFFDLTPTGVLLSKFSNDLSLLDFTLIATLYESLEGPTSVLIAIVNLCQININFMVPSVIFFAIAIWILIYSRPVILKCKELDLQSKNPIFSFFGETFNGLTQIRIFNIILLRLQQFSHLINQATKATYAFDLVSRGFGFYQILLTNILLSVGMFMGIIFLEVENKDLYGITMIYLITISQTFQLAVRQIIIAESLMVSAQRMLMFQTLPRQKEFRNDYDLQAGLSKEVEAQKMEEDWHQQWPQQSSLQFRNLFAKYRSQSPLVLDNVSFKVKPGQKIGVVGRTGAGKSSIIQVLFRLIEPQEGSVYLIDNFNALDLGLHSLRQHISVIPQTPFLFKGTIRQNIDPFESATDEQLWQILQSAGLSTHIRMLKDQMSTNISKSAQTFSVGQKQLLCLARALLRRNKFLILDEATSNVDMKTDEFIQRVIRQKFKNTTVITIAHRLNTIADYDRILVIEKGVIVEQGEPFQLIQRRGLFNTMVENTGKNAKNIIKKAKLSNQKKRAFT